MAGSELALLAGATRALAEVSTAKDAWELARTAEAARATTRATPAPHPTPHSPGAPT